MLNTFKNPILMHELRERIRNQNSFRLLSGFIGIIALLIWLLYLAQYDQAPSSSGLQSSLGQDIFQLLIVMTIIILMFLAGILAAHSITHEREHQTIDLLLTTQLTYGDIIIGKTLATLAFCGLLLASLTPLVAMTFLIGGVDVTTLVISYGILGSQIVLYTTIGVYWSARLNRNLAAMGATIVSLVLLTMIVPLLAEIILSTWGDRYIVSPWLTLIQEFWVSYNPVVLVLNVIDSIQNNETWSDTITIAQRTTSIPALWMWHIMLSWLASIMITRQSIRRLAPRASTTKETT
jgi:ABC-2 type transport system permease protein